MAPAPLAGLASSMVNRHKSGNKVRPSELSRLIGRFMAVIKSRIPAGYEDETGFNYGAGSISSSLEQPPENRTDRLSP
jgi:hypothetical protein